MIKKIYMGFFLMLSMSCQEFIDAAEKEPGVASEKIPVATDEASQKAPALPLRNDGAFNIAVAPGGGLNAYASIYLTYLFAAQSGKEIAELFDLYWGLSGGTLAATMFMNESSSKVLDNFKTQVKKAFPDIPSIIRAIAASPFDFQEILSDADGARRSAFNDSIIESLGKSKFSKNAGNKFVLVASADKNPLCYADSTILLPSSCIYKAPDGTSVADGIINSSNFQIAKNTIINLLPKNLKMYGGFLPDFSSLFQVQEISWLPGKKVNVIDGYFAAKNRLDGTSPLPLVIDYLLQFKTENDAEHNVVVFDNGSAVNAVYSNQAYRKFIGMDKNGYARIEKNGVVINVFLLKLNISKSQFDKWMHDKNDSHWARTEAVVNAEINGPRKNIFYQALNAINNSLAP